MSIPVPLEVEDIVVRDTRPTIPDPLQPANSIPNPNYNKIIVSYKTTVGPMAPLVLTAEGIQSSTSDNLLSIVREHWKMLLFTNPGEAISDPEFGCGLMTFLFQNMTGEVTKQYLDPSGGAQTNIVDTVYRDPISQMRSVINSQARRYLDYLTINSIDLIADEDTSAIQIKIAYRLDITGEQDVFNYEISDIYANSQFGPNNMNASDFINQYS